MKTKVHGLDFGGRLLSQQNSNGSAQVCILIIRVWFHSNGSRVHVKNFRGLKAEPCSDWLIAFPGKLTYLHGLGFGGRLLSQQDSNGSAQAPARRSPENDLKVPSGGYKRCRPSWLTTSAPVYERGGRGELRGLSQWVQLYTGAQINFGDLTP